MLTQGCETLRAPGTPYRAWTTPPDWANRSLAPGPVWQSIREIEIDTSRPLELPDLIDISLLNNPQIRQAWQNAKETEAQLTQAKSQLYPQVTSAGAINFQIQTDDLALNVENMIYNPSLRLTYLLFDLGGRRALINGAVQTLLSNNLQFNQKIQDIILLVSTTYYNFNSFRDIVKEFELSVEDNKKGWHLAQKRYSAGLVTRLDVIQAKSSYLGATYSLENAKGQVEAARANLAKAIGLSSDYDFSVSAPPDQTSTLISEENVSDLIEEALKNRPELASLRANLRAREEDVKVANSAIWPTLNAGGYLDLNWYHYFKKSIPLNTQDQRYVGYVSVDWDIFNGFKNIAQKRASQARAKAAREELANAELEASAEVWSSYYLFKAAMAKVVTSDDYLKISTDSHNLAYISYKSGLVDILYLLQSQDDLIQSRIRFVSAKQDLLVSLADLAYATGSLGPTKPDKTTDNPDKKTAGEAGRPVEPAPAPDQASMGDRAVAQDTDTSSSPYQSGDENEM